MSRDLMLLALSLATWGLGEGMFFYFQPLYLEQLGASPLAIGAILSAVGVGMTVAHIPAGLLADRLGRRPMMWASWIMGMVAGWIMALAPSLPFFVAGMLLYSITAFVMAPMNSYITAARGSLSVGRAITLISAAYSTGAVLGPTLGGLLGDRVGLRPVYLVAAGVFVVSTSIILFIRPQPVEPEAHTRSLRRMFTPRLSTYLATVLLVMTVLYLPQPLAPNYLQNVRGLSVGAIGQMGSLTGLGVVVLNLLLGQLPAHVGFLLGQIAIGAFAWLIWRGEGLWAIRMGYFLLGGYRTVRSLAAAQVRELVDTAHMGLAYGLVETVSGAGTILAPAIAGWLYTLEPAWMFRAALFALAVSLPLSLLSAPRPVPTPAAQASTPGD